MSDIHDSIQRVLAALRVRPLATFDDTPPANDFNKAGILLFLPAQTTEKWRFCLMRPQAKHPELGAPLFQLPKGTRMQHIGGKWVDIGNNDTVGPTAETLAATALREAVEEVGLVLSNMVELWDAGPVSFSSASTGASKSMWLFAGELKSADDFLPMEDVATTTSERALLTRAELIHVRPDHAAMVERVMTQLYTHHIL